MSIPQVDLELAKKVLAAEGQAIVDLAGQIAEPFACAARMIFACTGQVVLTGIGKAGIVAQKISATLASTGTHSIYLHPVEALHGDLGRVQRGDVVIGLSHSGTTEEIIRLIDHIKSRGASVISLTASADSPLGRYSDVVICYGQVDEACPWGLAPTVSTSCMLALGDALALTVMRMRDFTPENFAAFHPAGELGRKLLKVEEAMIVRKDDKRLCVLPQEMPLGEALVAAEQGGRRIGAMLLADADGKLSGILTDADLRRALAQRRDENMFDRPVSELMTPDPLHIHLGELAAKALGIINEHRIDELPVLDQADRPVGIIDVQDLIGIKTVNNDRKSD